MVMLKTKIYEIELSEAYQAITDEDISYYKKIQVLNDTEEVINYKFNNDTAEQELAVGDIFELDSLSTSEPCADTIYMQGNGTVKVELQYYPIIGFPRT